MNKQTKIVISILLHRLAIVNFVFTTLFMIVYVGYIEYCHISKQYMPVKVFLSLFYMLFIVPIPGVLTEFAEKYCDIESQRQTLLLCFGAIILYSIFFLIITCIIGLDRIPFYMPYIYTLNNHFW